MISGNKIKLIPALLLLLIHVHASAAGSLKLESLLESLTTDKMQQLRYQEHKTMAILEQTLITNGWLYFEPPDRLIRELDGDANIRYIISQDQMLQERNGRVFRRLALSEYPKAAAIPKLLTGLLAGDAAALKTWFKVALNGDLNQWTLHLIPRSSQWAATISGIEIDGARGMITSINATHANGDTTLTTLSPGGSD